jgi:hypothetical protein
MLVGNGRIHYILVHIQKFSNVLTPKIAQLLGDEQVFFVGARRDVGDTSKVCLAL